MPAASFHDRHVARVDAAVGSYILTEVSSAHDRADLDFGLANVARVNRSVAVGVADEQPHRSGEDRAHVPGAVMNIEQIDGNSLRGYAVRQINRNVLPATVIPLTEPVPSETIAAEAF